ncbi:hypothetical protein PV10_05836 [Exophiala mesophila]|uniref:FAD-binding FR-type domain-containing protein n=1 Tax=Exophiala mesophila TaxID=212818 RepID=A0A0D1XT11_EXOME|nr:uncharacterized protein PV10_05836 [Exophiala mesophila]KIV91281.1 hypothetical protein PV10_05836 [Exophiala mesophila]
MVHSRATCLLARHQTRPTPCLRNVTQRFPLKPCFKSSQSNNSLDSSHNPHPSGQVGPVDIGTYQKKHQKNGSTRNKLVAIGLGLLAAPVAWYAYQTTEQDRRLHSLGFVKYSLVAKEPVSKSASIFQLVPKDDKYLTEIDKTFSDLFKSGIWSVEFKQPQLQIVRAYTPLPPSVAADQEQNKNTGLRFLIRHDARGEVSSYLHRLPLGADIEVRRPSVSEYPISKHVRQVIFLAGGTGIAPALQVAHALFEGAAEDGVDHPRKDCKLHILWANRTRDDCIGGVSDQAPGQQSKWYSFLYNSKKSKQQNSPIAQQGAMVQELESLKERYPGQITVEYFVDEEGTFINEPAVCNALSRLTSPGHDQSHGASKAERQLFISGPDGFISYLAGPKMWRNGVEEQGPLANMVARAIAKQACPIAVWKV